MMLDGAAMDAVLGRGEPAFLQRVKGRTLINMATTSPAYSKALESDILAAGGLIPFLKAHPDWKAA